MRLALPRGVVLALALVLASPLAGSAPARAQQDEARLRAKGHFAEGKRLFNLGKFKEAAHYFQKAYEAKALPLFLYNLGQCHRHIGDLPALKKAVFYYRGYINNSPGATDRAKVERTIEKLDKRIAQLEADKKKEQAKQPKPRPDLVPDNVPPPREPQTRSKPIYKTWWFWTALSAVVVGAGLGIGFGVAESVDNWSPEGPGHSDKSYQLWRGAP